MVLLVGEWNQQFSGKALDPHAARASFVLVSCLHQPPMCLVTVGRSLPLAA